MGLTVMEGLALKLTQVGQKESLQRTWRVLLELENYTVGYASACNAMLKVPIPLLLLLTLSKLKKHMLTFSGKL